MVQFMKQKQLPCLLKKTNITNVKLTDLLMEVASWTEFDEQFIHGSTNRPPKGEEKTVLMAALMEIGTNIGLRKWQMLLSSTS